MDAPSPDSLRQMRNAMPRVRVAARKPAGTFDLLRWYSLASLAVMTVVAIAFAVFGSRFLAVETLQRDAVLTAQFIDSMLETESQHWGFLPHASLAEFLDPKVDPTQHGFTVAQVSAARSEFYDHVRMLPDELLANVYATDRTIVWSSNPALIGHIDTSNKELAAAFASQEMVAKGHLERAHSKHEQAFLVEPKQVFIENYIPLRSVGGEVVAVVEIYKEPRDLMAIIERGERLVWVGSGFAAIVLYLVTFGIVRRGHRMLMNQQQHLLENETLVAVGELSTAIAHSLRNPLASIRTSAELALDDTSPRAQKSAGDIVRQVDRMSRWIKELLLFTRPQAAHPEVVALRQLVCNLVADFSSQLEGRGIEFVNELPADLPAVSSNRTMLAQALQSVFSNAVEAIVGPGRIVVSAARSGDRLSLRIGDSGRGMSPAQLATAFRPFVTHKASGLGVGLAIVRQVMERFGGDVELASQEGVGTDVFLHFRIASAEQ